MKNKMSINKVILVGICGKDPEIRQTKDGKEIASFSLATNEKWKEKSTGEQKEKTEWHNISVFGGIVGIVKNYVKKGSKLYIEGKLQTDKYEKDGVEKYTTKIVIQGFNSTLQLLNKIEDGGISQHSKDKGNGYQQQEEEEFESDSVPF
jgi:single-strand DNA-binding protein